MAGNPQMIPFEDPEDREGFLKLAKYPLIKHTDMLEEMVRRASDAPPLGPHVSASTLHSAPGRRFHTLHRVRAAHVPFATPS